MRLRVLLFAVAKERAGREAIEVSLGDNATVGELRAELARQCAALAPVLERSMIAINQRYALDDEPIPPSAEVACIPPVSGG